MSPDGLQNLYLPLSLCNFKVKASGLHGQGILKKAKRLDFQELSAAKPKANEVFRTSSNNVCMQLMAKAAVSEQL